jgi:hypothetical protein
MAKQYAGGALPPVVLTTFLSALTRKKAAVAELGEWEDSSFNVKACYLAGSLTRLSATAGSDVGTLYAAMLMKKRVAVCGGSFAELQMTVRSLPMLVWHRQSWELMRPYVTASGPEVAELEATGVWVAGFAGNAREEISSSLYDVLLDLDSGKVTVSEHAQEAFRPVGFVQEVGQLLGEENVEDQQLLKNVLAKTKALVSKIQTLATPKVTMEQLSQVAPVHMDKFLYNVALAENLA